jgi:hypothetical protein
LFDGLVWDLIVANCLFSDTLRLLIIFEGYSRAGVIRTLLQKELRRHRRSLSNLGEIESIMLSPRIISEAERCAVRGYTHICNMTAGKDHRTYDLSQAIPNEEIEQELWFSEFLGEETSGHFMRRGGTSPFVSKVLK